jgi:Capsule assembly protein Wzi
MPKTLTVLVIWTIMTPILQAASSSDRQDAQQARDSEMASTYVALDTWVYSAFERLAAEGYVQTAFFSLRPWTRLDCARLIEEADDQIANEPVTPETSALLRSLKLEFAAELERRAGVPNREFRLESLDQRVTAIAGRPLTDGFHFAETLVDDEGRPFAEGANLYSGTAFRATAGPFAAYIKSELQRVPLAPVPDANAEQQIAVADFTSTAAAGPASGFLRGRVLEANASFAFSNNQFTVGRQSLWWGPAQSGATLFSNNEEPMDMIRYDRVRPFELPGFLRPLGPIRVQLLVGRLSGTQFVQPLNIQYGTSGVALKDQPFIHGEKISFKPTQNFEFSVSRTTIFGGTGSPLNFHSFLVSVFSAGTQNGDTDPGDRRQAFDASYRIPGLRQCLTGYFDGFADDQPFPLLYPTESAWLSGLFLRCVPHLPRVTMRVEGLLSPRRDLAFPGFFYFNVHYLSGYTNNRQLIGSWIGREAQGEQAWATWHFSPHSVLEVSGRSQNVNREFLQGGTLRDLRAAADIALHPEWQLRMEEQTEWWQFPLLSTAQQHNAVFTIQLSYNPVGRGAK